MANIEYVSVKNREFALTQRRHLKMARSAHAYVRGSTVKFYEWLENSAETKTIPDGPPVWICGDCHLGNLGPIGNVSGSIEIQIRDLDQTVIGNPAHDLIRLGLSLASAARGSDLPGVTTAKMTEQLVDGYELAFQDMVSDKIKKKPETINLAMIEAKTRTWKQLARERIEDTKPTVPLGQRFWPLAKSERKAIQSLFEASQMRSLVTMLRSRDEDGPVEFIDAGYWMKGCSSLGLLRFVVLLGVGSKKDFELCIMDVKEATKAAAPHYADAKMPADNGRRIIEGARHLSPHFGERMRAATLLNKSVFVRELLPQDMKFDLEHLKRDEALSVARYLANVVGQAHARQMDGATKLRWAKELNTRRSKSLDAPSWLWTSIVDLLATHERAYLEHCRVFALS